MRGRYSLRVIAFCGLLLFLGTAGGVLSFSLKPSQEAFLALLARAEGRLRSACQEIKPRAAEELFRELQGNESWNKHAGIFAMGGLLDDLFYGPEFYRVTWKLNPFWTMEDASVEYEIVLSDIEPRQDFAALVKREELRESFRLGNATPRRNFVHLEVEFTLGHLLVRYGAPRVTITLYRDTELNRECAALVASHLKGLELEDVDLRVAGQTNGE